MVPQAAQVCLTLADKHGGTVQMHCVMVAMHGGVVDMHGVLCSDSCVSTKSRASTSFAHLKASHT